MNKGFQIFSYHLVLINAIVLPIQGFLNALVYSRNDASKFMKNARRRISSSLSTSLRKSVERMFDENGELQHESSTENIDENDRIEENH